MKFITQTLAASICAAAFVATAPMASAATVKVVYDGVSPGVSMNVDTNKTSATKWVSTVAGQANLTVKSGGTGSSSLDGLGSILAWCVELTESVVPTRSYTYTVVEGESLVDSWVNAVARLFTAHQSDLAGPNSNAAAAAMQMAIWQLVTGDTDNNVTGGNFKVKKSGATNASDYRAAVKLANSWLADLKNQTEVGWTIVKLVNAGANGKPGAQDLITFQQIIPTPLPGAALLFLSALGLGGLARRTSLEKERAAT